MAQKVTAPRGMRDVLPAEKRKREAALRIIRDVYRSHGFDEIEAPALEDYDRLHSGLGGDNEKLSFSVLKRGLSGEDFAKPAETGRVDDICDLGLRFDLTVPLARYYASNQAELPAVFRAVHIGPVWRAERPQKGRYRQFVQSDIDIIGDPSLLAEAELITATSWALDALNINDCVIRINDRRILTGMLTAAGFKPEDHEKALITIDKLDKIWVAGVIAELAEIDAAAAQNIEKILREVEPHLSGDGIQLTREAIVQIIPEDTAPEAIDALAELATSLENGLPAGVRLVFDPTLVRGMGYYTGTIFEIAHPGSGSSVGGGGRYDGMIGRFLGRDVPAVGFSLGFERIIGLANLAGAGESKRLGLIYDAELPIAQIMSAKQALTADGFDVQLVKQQKNMKPVFAYLEETGFTHVANLRADTVGVPDVRTLAS